MFELPGYRMMEMLNGRQHICFYRLLRQSDGQTVIAGTTAHADPDAKCIAGFRRMYAWLSLLGGRGAARPLGLKIGDGQPVILMEDIGGITFDRLRHASHEWNLERRLPIAVALVHSLAQMHHALIDVREIKPWQLLVNPDTGEVKWIDLSGCDALESGQIPDFSSLGAFLETWLADRQLYGERHVAIRQKVMDVIDRCKGMRMHLNYADATEIRLDLEACLSMLLPEKPEASGTFLSQSEQMQVKIPDRLYGRIAERAQLLAALRRVSEGAAEVVWVSGLGGIGKTTFVRETLADPDSPEAWFAFGKFDSRTTAIPYDVWVQTLDQLVGMLLQDGQMNAESWKERILEAADGNAQLIIELIPRLESLIGPQPPIRQLPPVEAQRRFQMVIKRFIQLFVQQGRPLVLFLDDLQWADEGSLHVLSYLMTDCDLGHLLIVCAYRADEVDGRHPLVNLQQQLASKHVAVQHIYLPALGLADLKQLLADTLRPEAENLAELAAVLHDKTAGNPFFVKRFLQDLLDRRHIAFDGTAKRWHWDLQQIIQMEIAETAAAYMTTKLRHQSEELKHVLQRAAALGSQFALDMLFPILDLETDRVFAALGQAVRAGFLLQISGEKIVYKFQHDRIRQAAYSLIDESRRADLHLRIGLQLRRRMPLDPDIRLYDVLDHINIGLERIVEPARRLEAAQLNLQAGLQAKHATAYETALVYLRHVTALLPESAWTDNYALTFQAYRERAETEYLCANFQIAADLFDLLLKKAASNLDQASVCIMRIQLEASQDNYREVLELGRKALALLKVRCNLAPNAFAVALQWRKVKRKLAGRSVESLAELPPMTDPVRKLVMAILMHTSHANFYLHQNGWASNILTMLETTLDFGMTPEASVSFAGYALLVYYQLKQDEEASKWAKLAIRLSAPYPLLHVRSLTVYAICMDSWRRYDPEHLQRFSEKAGKVALESGDLWQANQSLLLNCAMLFQFSHPLHDLYERLLAGAEVLQRHNNSVYWKQAALLAALISRLRGIRRPDDPFASEDILDPGFYRSVHGDRLNLMEEFVCLYRYITGYLFGEYRDAEEALARASAIIKSRRQISKSESQCLYECLVWAQLHGQCTAAKRLSIGIRIRRNLRVLQRSAARCPENYLHKYLLAQAEWARLRRQDQQADRFYAQSIAAASANGHIHDEAIAAECYGKFLLGRRMHAQAIDHLSSSIRAYRKWGALAKADELTRQYQELLQT